MVFIVREGEAFTRGADAAVATASTVIAVAQPVIIADPTVAADPIAATTTCSSPKPYVAAITAPSNSSVTTVKPATTTA